jgi:hypothetical protein
MTHCIEHRMEHDAVVQDREGGSMNQQILFVGAEAKGQLLRRR